MREPAAADKETAVDRLLLLVSDVRAGEGHTALLMMTNLFLLLTGYLIIKTVREALILSEGGAVVKSYAAAGQALLLLAFMPVYSYVGSRVGRIKLVNGVTIFFIFNLLVFYLLARLQVALGVPFFLWVGIFNLFAVAQFWSFANDIYSEEQGKRLFPIIACGGSLGAVLGPKIAGSLFESFGAYGLMLVTAAFLGVSVVLLTWVNQRARHTNRARISERPLGRQGAVKLIAGQPYLILIAALMVGSNWVNTTGEFLLGQKVTEEARRVAVADTRQRMPLEPPSSSMQAVTQKKMQDFIARFYGNFFFTVSLITALAQFFLVSRIIKFCGVPASLFFLPIIALGELLDGRFGAPLGYYSFRQSFGKQHRLLAAKHRAPGAVSANQQRSQIQSQDGHRHTLRPHGRSFVHGAGFSYPPGFSWPQSTKQCQCLVGRDMATGSNRYRTPL